jgi:hypothetical protein
MQNSSLDPSHLKVSACCKHFAAYSIENGDGNNRYSFNAIVTEQVILFFIIPFSFVLFFFFSFFIIYVFVIILVFINYVMFILFMSRILLIHIFLRLKLASALPAQQAPGSCVHMLQSTAFHHVPTHS